MTKTAYTVGEDGPSGTQTLWRATKILKHLAERAHQGWRLVDLARQCDLDKGTAHRILAFLVQERLARQRAADRHYFPGPLLYELGLSLPDVQGFVSDCERPLATVSKKLHVTSYLYLRSGMDFVCASRSGSVTRGLLVDVGSRHPLVYSAGGVAIAIALPREEARGIVAANLQRIKLADDKRLDGVKKMLRRSRDQGYGINIGDTTRGVHAFGVAMLDKQNRAFASLVVAGSAESLPAAGAATIVGTLRAAVQEIASRSTHLAGS